MICKGKSRSTFFKTSHTALGRAEGQVVRREDGAEAGGGVVAKDDAFESLCMA